MIQNEQNHLILLAQITTKKLLNKKMGMQHYESFVLISFYFILIEVKYLYITDK